MLVITIPLGYFNLDDNIYVQVALRIRTCAAYIASEHFQCAPHQNIFHCAPHQNPPIVQSIRTLALNTRHLGLRTQPTLNIGFGNAVVFIGRFHRPF